ncbi:gliding motility lipoprotein GldH [Salinimicrobium sp. GXAS 041]|uniref:gliding motility lipoprotein GldH n=1 Tax=Salinimicrobium sp. GXAS 041 TaxID=3400806 RepID=UPI003C748BE0
MHKAFWISLFTCFLLFSCDKKRVVDKYESIPNQWHKDSVVSFNFTPPDTIRPYNLFINLRNNSDYRFSNLFLVANMTFPNGKVVSDTLEYRMAEPSGKWLGTGFGELKENKLWYKENVRFSEEGEYQINIEQAMRKGGDTDGIQDLEGITEVGFRIEKTDN